jgi:uncharacterized protein (DUF1800 family)
MKKNALISGWILLLFLTTSFAVDPPLKTHFPYHEAGLTERQAVAHLISRFTFGVQPGDIEKVMALGLEKWFHQQLQGAFKEDVLKKKLSSLDALGLSNREAVMKFPSVAQLKQMMVRDGVVSKDSIANLDKKEFKPMVDEYRKKNGLREEKELFRQFYEQKILRACFSENQLHEVLTDFWFNHFNVSITKNQCARFIPAYERDAIRPHVSGKFEDMLLATAKSPAMLLYLDNASSSGENPAWEAKAAARQARRNKRKGANAAAPHDKKLPKRKNQGLNENYARELMELHTLGVDGGYSQKDVTEAARVLTGWTTFQLNDKQPVRQLKRPRTEKEEFQRSRNGFVHDGDFLFAINKHDPAPKTVLGQTFSSEGYQEGVSLLHLLAHHPSTAQFISRKLAVHFVSDNPPQSLVDAMAETFLKSNGDISYVLTSMVHSPEFWSPESLRAKIKSPFEYAIGAVRGLKADVKNPLQLNQWITRMGQRLYNYQAPTGFPDRAQYWINTGSLLNRMNFGLALATKKIPGIMADLAALTNHQEPESSEEALTIYAKLLLPERNLDSTLMRLKPLVSQPEIQKNIEQASQKTDTAKMKYQSSSEADRQTSKPKDGFNNHQMLAQVVGIVIGSPEFQRK